MSLHIGEMTSQVSVEGVPPVAGAPAGEGKAPPPWEQLDRHRRLTEVQHDAERRTAGEGFDG